jgi:anti-anti-sigma regulatory factor
MNKPGAESLAGRIIEDPPFYVIAMTCVTSASTASFYILLALFDRVALRQVDIVLLSMLVAIAPCVIIGVIAWTKTRHTDERARAAARGMIAVTVLSFLRLFYWLAGIPVWGSDMDFFAVLVDVAFQWFALPFVFAAIYFLTRGSAGERRG